MVEVCTVMVNNNNQPPVVDHNRDQLEYKYSNRMYVYKSHPS